MNKLVWISLCILLAVLLSCCKTKPAVNTDTDKPEPTQDSGAIITFTSETETADIWIIPDTEENRKTSLWGTATIAKLETSKESQVSLDALGGPGTYLLRMIDTEHFYYEANGITLEDGSSMRLIKEANAPLAFSLEVTGADGASTESYEVFTARL